MTGGQIEHDALTEGVAVLAERVSVLTGAVRAGRRLTRWLALSIALDLLLSVGVTSAVIELRHVQVEACQQENKTRAGQLKLWTPVLAAPRAPLSPTASPDDRRAYDDATRARDRFERDLHRLFDPLKC